MAINPLPLAGVGLAAVAVAGGLYATGTGTSDTPSGQQTLVEQEPTWHSLFEDSDYNEKIKTDSADYHGKYGASYNKYLVGKDEKNNDWWNQIFKKKFRDEKPTLSDKFKGLLQDNKVGTDLRDICVEAYKAKKEGPSPLIKETGATETNFLEENIWKFCSPIGKKPIPIGENDGYQSGKIGKDAEKSKLASAKGDENDKFWEIKQKHFFSGTQPDQSKDAFFKKLYDDQKGNPQPLSLKGKCHEAYDKTGNDSSSATEPTKEEVKKYCSLEETATTAQAQ